MIRLLNDIVSKFQFQNLVNKDSLVQLKRYIIVGLTSFAVEYIMFFVLYKLLNLWYVLSNGIVYAITFWISFLLNRNWSFQSKGKFSRQLVLYLLLFIINLSISSYIIYLLSDKLIINPLFSKILTMGLIITWNFIIYKKIIYIER
jgi:putative flippase GtrA